MAAAPQAPAGALSAVVRFALRFRGIVIALASLWLLYGIYVLGRTKYDVFPEFAVPRVSVDTEAPGLSPEQVEILVTRPLESAIVGVEGIDHLLSTSIQGLSSIKAIFSPGIDVYRARQLVSERLLAVAGRLPREAGAPQLTPLTSSTGTVLEIGLTSSRRSLLELRTFAEWTLRLRLLAAPGVASVVVYGVGPRQLQVQVLPDRLVKYDLALDDVLQAARRATGVRGAGFLETSNQRIVLQSEGQATTPAQLARTVLRHQEGANVTLGDVALVTAAARPPIGAALIDGQPGMVLVISAQLGANTLEVTRGVEQALDQLRPAMLEDGIELHPDLFRPADFIHTATHNMLTVLAIGAALVVLVLALFLFDLRTAAISCTAIPLSLVTATVVLERLGLTLNIMTLGGLAIAIGEIVDDAVIDVENIFRRLRENQRLDHPRSLFRVVLDASVEVRGAVVYATFAVLLVFLPILALSGVAGRIFAPLGEAYVLAVLASLLVALTVTPALCLVLLRRAPDKEPPLVGFLRRPYGELLRGVERRPRIVLAAVLVLLAGGAVALPFLSATFLPPMREGQLIVHMTAMPGTSLDESLRMGGQVTRALQGIPYVRTVGQKAGRAELGAETRSTNASEFDAALVPSEQPIDSESDLRQVLARFPGVDFAVNSFLTERIEETISGAAAAVVVNVFGNDLDVLDRKGQEVANVLRGVRGAVDVLMAAPTGAPQVVVSLREQALGRWGLESVQVLDAVRTAYGGTIVGQIYSGEEAFDVSVILARRDRQSVAAVGRLPVRAPGGAHLPLAELADIRETTGRYAVLHRGGRRVQTVTCNVAGRGVSAFVDEARRQIGSRVRLPAGTYVEFAGAAAAEARSRRDLLVHSLMAALGVVLLLSVVLRSYRRVLLVLLNLPFALAGAVLIALATGASLSLGSLIGFVTVVGITLRNSIMLMSHYDHLVTVEGMAWGLDTALRGAEERLAPILMTAMVTALGLLPLALGSKAPGREIEGPMAIVILGGLVTSTALNLLVMPTLAFRYGRFEKPTEPPDSAPARRGSAIAGRRVDEGPP